MAQYFMFICPNCRRKIAVTKEEAEYSRDLVDLEKDTDGITTFYQYHCTNCKYPIFIEGSLMQPIDDPALADMDKWRELPVPTEVKRLKKIELTINHFRSYQYGEPFEGQPVAMSRAFDIVNDDAEVILLGLEVLKDLQEMEISLETDVNYRVREKKIKEIIQKMKDGIKE